MLLAQALSRSYGFVEIAIFIVVLAAIAALVYVALQKFGVTIPAWILHCFWIVIVAIVVIFCIRFVATL